MVRLREYIVLFAKMGKIGFNSNMVRLRENHNAKKQQCETAFQFQYGAIKSQVKLIGQAHSFGFNSNMVRLRGVWFRQIYVSPKLFQFQYGAIKRISHSGQFE